MGRTNQPDPEIATSIGRLKEAVLSRRPVLRQILTEHGDVPLRRYAQRYHQVASAPEGADRRAACIQLIADETRRRLGHTIAESVARQLTHHYYLSTADHHGPIVHPFFLSSNLLSAANYVEDRNPNHANIIALACASISLENSSFPRGLLFHSQATGALTLQKFPFLSSHLRPSLVNLAPPYGQLDMLKVDQLITAKQRAGEITETEGEQLRALIQDEYLDPHVLAGESFSDQLTKSNWALWQRYFPTSVAAPNLVYLELETVVTRLLQHHLTTPTFVHKLLFHPEWAEFVNRFEGILGAFNRATKYGTYFFWAVPPGARYRQQLWREGQWLVTDDGSYRIELTSEAIGRALRANELVPSLLVSYLLLACYYGLELLGGFSQTTYLADMKAAYLAIAEAVGDRESAAIAQPVQTDKLGGDFVLAFLETPTGEMLPATGLDLLFHGPSGVAWERFLESTRRVTIDEALSPMLPEFYRIIYPEAERDPALAAVTAEEITEASGAYQKIQPVVSLRLNR